jgi:hypothetical protein
MSGRSSVFRGLLLAALAGCASGFIPAPAFAAEDMSMPFHHHDGDLLLFPDITGTHLNTPVPGLSRNELMPELNLFYSTDHERLRFLAEFLLNRDEQEMERLQLGWLVQPTTTLWLGRFHNPLGFWNTEHHHGAYLQTTISRPGIINFEDEGGVLPTHVAGLLGEGAHDLERGYGSLNYAFGLGRGPNMESGLDPVNILELRNGGKLAASARLSYRTQDDSSEFGGFAGYTRIPVVGASLDEIEQNVAGAFYNWEDEKLRLVGEVFYVGNRLKDGVTRHADFSAAYLQAEYHAHPDWTLFGRLEGSHGTQNNAYLDRIPDFLRTRTVAGARFEVANHQALKLELSHNERQDDVRFNQLSLQWSMVYP